MKELIYTAHTINSLLGTIPTNLIICLGILIGFLGAATFNVLLRFFKKNWVKPNHSLTALELYNIKRDSYQEGQTEGLDLGYKNGFRVGKANGLTEGEASGIIKGKAEGYELMKDRCAAFLRESLVMVEKDEMEIIK